MTDETPTQGEPTQPVAPTPAAPAPPAEPAAATTEPTEVVAPAAVAASATTAETGAVPPAPPAGSPTPTAAAAVPPARSGFFVPKWLAIVGGLVLAALVFGGIGYAIGDSNGGSDRGTVFGFRGGNNNLPFGNGGPFGQGNGNRGNGNQGNGNQTTPNQGGGGSQTPSTSGAFLGVSVSAPQSGSGAQVTTVRTGSPADTAGLKAGDVITAVDGTSIGSAADLASAIQNHSAGDTVTIAYTRDGKDATVQVKLASRATANAVPS